MNNRRAGELAEFLSLIERVGKLYDEKAMALEVASAIAAELMLVYEIKVTPKKGDKK